MQVWMRQLHRWLSLVFTLAVVINLGAMMAGSTATWVGLLALPPLLFMMVTGVYLFALPYRAKRSSGEQA